MRVIFYCYQCCVRFAVDVENVDNIIEGIKMKRNAKEWLDRIENCPVCGEFLDIE